MRELVNRALQTERLVLEPVCVAHAGEAWEGLQDPRLWIHFPALAPKTPADLEARYARWAKPEAGNEAGEIWGNWMCRKKATRKLVGSIQATILPPASAHVAYMIFVNEQRKGYAKEALEELITHLRDRVRLQHLYAEISPQNVPSLRLIAALGFAPAAGLDMTWELPLLAL